MIFTVGFKKVMVQCHAYINVPGILTALYLPFINIKSGIKAWCQRLLAVVLEDAMATLPWHVVTKSWNLKWNLITLSFFTVYYLNVLHDEYLLPKRQRTWTILIFTTYFRGFFLRTWCHIHVRSKKYQHIWWNSRFQYFPIASLLRLNSL